MKLVYSVAMKADTYWRVSLPPPLTFTLVHLKRGDMTVQEVSVWVSKTKRLVVKLGKKHQKEQIRLVNDMTESERLKREEEREASSRRRLANLAAAKKREESEIDFGMSTAHVVQSAVDLNMLRQ